jgi:hypothetical protein
MHGLPPPSQPKSWLITGIWLTLICSPLMARREVYRKNLKMKIRAAPAAEVLDFVYRFLILWDSHRYQRLEGRGIQRPRRGDFSLQVTSARLSFDQFCDVSTEGLNCPCIDRHSRAISIQDDGPNCYQSLSELRLRAISRPGLLR